MPAKILAIILAFGLIGAVARHADAAGADAERFPYPDQREVERVCKAGEEACRDALDSFGRLSETFRAMSRDMARFWSKAGEEFAREMAPALRDLADRLDEMARQLERPREPETI